MNFCSRRISALREQSVQSIGRGSKTTGTSSAEGIAAMGGEGDIDILHMKRFDYAGSDMGFYPIKLV